MGVEYTVKAAGKSLTLYELEAFAQDASAMASDAQIDRTTVRLVARVGFGGGIKQITARIGAREGNG